MEDTEIDIKDKIERIISFTEFIETAAYKLEDEYGINHEILSSNLYELTESLEKLLIQYNKEKMNEVKAS